MEVNVSAAVQTVDKNSSPINFPIVIYFPLEQDQMRVHNLLGMHVSVIIFGQTLSQ